MYIQNKKKVREKTLQQIFTKLKIHTFIIQYITSAIAKKPAAKKKI